MNKVVNIRYAKSGTYIRIDRSGKWGNPYVVGKSGDLKQCLEWYTDWIGCQYTLLADLQELEDIDLGCWCAPPEGLTTNLSDGFMCHGQVLLFLVEENKALREEMAKHE